MWVNIIGVAGIFLRLPEHAIMNLVFYRTDYKWMIKFYFKVNKNVLRCLQIYDSNDWNKLIAYWLVVEISGLFQT